MFRFVGVNGKCYLFDLHEKIVQKITLFCYSTLEITHNFPSSTDKNYFVQKHGGSGLGILEYLEQAFIL